MMRQTQSSITCQFICWQTWPQPTLEFIIHRLESYMKLLGRKQEMSCPVIQGLIWLCEHTTNHKSLLISPPLLLWQQHMELQVFFFIYHLGSVIVAVKACVCYCCCKCMTSSAHNSRRQPCRLIDEWGRKHDETQWCAEKAQSNNMMCRNKHTWGTAYL